MALVNPHLGPAERNPCCYDMASTLCSGQFEILLLATQSRDDRWLGRWRERVEHVYDLAKVVPPEKMIAALCSIIANWRCDYVVIQNSLYGYAAIPHIKKMLPGMQDLRRDPCCGQCLGPGRIHGRMLPHRSIVRVAMSEAVRDAVAGVPDGRSAGAQRRGSGAIPASATQFQFHKEHSLRRPPGSREAAAAGGRYRQGAGRASAAARFPIRYRGRRPRRKNASMRRVRKLGLDDVFDFRGQVDDSRTFYAAVRRRDSSVAQRRRAVGDPGSFGQRAAGSGVERWIDSRSPGFQLRNLDRAL